MYDADQMEGSNISWSQTMDLVRFMAADNEFETISDEVFPDIDTETAANDESNPKALQFRGVEMIDFHGNLLQAIPTGLRWLERLTVVNLVSFMPPTNHLLHNILTLESVS